MEHGLGEIQALGDRLRILSTGVISWHNQGTLVTSLLWHSTWGLASTRSKLVSEMLSDEPGSVSYSKPVRLDVVRCPSLNRQAVTESRAKGNGTLVVSHT